MYVCMYKLMIFTSYCLVPTPSITLNTIDDVYNVGILLSLRCDLLLKKENVDVNTMATVKLYKNNIMKETRMISGDAAGESLTYSANFSFSSINISDSGIYKCEGFVDDDINSSFIIPSDVVEDYITVNVKSECSSF